MNIVKITEFLLQNSLQVAFLALIVLIYQIISRRENPALYYSLNFLLLIKLIIPPVLAVPVKISSTKLPAIFLKEVVFTASKRNLTEGFEVSSIKEVFFYIWLTGLIIMFSYLVYNSLKLLRNSIKAKAVKNKNIEHLLNSFNLKKKVTVKSSEVITTPLVFGLFRYTILLPKRTLEWSREDLDLIIAHEAAHILRKDPFMLAFQNILKIIYFFNPLIWLLDKKMTIQREQLSDLKAVEILNTTNKNYVKKLYRNIEDLVDNHRGYLLVNSLSHSGKALKKRFNYLLKTKGTKMKMNLWEKCLVLALLIIGFTLSANPAKNQTPAEIGNEAVKQSKTQEVVDFFEAKVKPKHKGGIVNLYKNLEYPKEAREAGKGGRVTLRFICGADGKAKNIKILQEEPMEYGFGQASINALKKVEFIPGQDNNGKAVDISMVQPIFFRIK